MKVRTIRERLLASTMIGGAALMAFATPAFAQDPVGEDEVEEIVITGTRIPQANLVTTSPVTQVTGADIDTAGVTRVEDLVNQLPQAFAAQNSTVANGASGTATVSLRNLGSSRTLVLIDGKRMPYGSPNDDAADLNQIPGQLVERVEVLTGGSSAVYGSDAVAGVVNFIMRRDFEGVQFDAQYGFYQHNNDYDGPGNIRDTIEDRAATNPGQFSLPDDNVQIGASREATVVFGVSSPDGRGNITAYASYRRNNKVLGRDYDYASCSIGAPNATTGPDAFSCGGSGTAFPGTFTSFGSNAFVIDPDGDPETEDDQFDANPIPDFNFTVDQGTGEFRPFNAALDQYNFGPLNYFQRPDERYSLGAFARYEVNDHVELYADIMFTDYSSVAQIAPSGLFFPEVSRGSRTSDGSAFINCDNPLLSPTQATALGCGAAATAAFNTFVVFDPNLGPIDPGTGEAPGGFVLSDESNPDAFRLLDDPNYVPLFIGRRNVEGGGRQDSLNYESYRMVGGSRGAINDSWSYDLSGQFSRVRLSRTYNNDFSNSRIARALDVVDVDGTPTCTSVVNGTDATCVPYNPFDPAGVTPEALAYLQIPLIQTGSTSLQVLTATVNGDLGAYGIQSPMADSGLQVAFGAEYQRNELESTTDNAFATGDGAGQGGPTIGLAGVNDNFDVFAEFLFPLIEGRPGFDRLTIDGAYRRSDYQLGGEADSYKLGLDYAPVPDIRFRASYQQAVRAPNVIELFTAQGFNLFDQDFDPCDANEDNVPAGYTPPASCFGAGSHQVTAAQSNNGGLTSPAGQYNFLQGGSTALEPETAKTYTVGFVLQPDALPGFNASVDYFSIEVEDLISTIGALNTINGCYFNNQASACSLIQRNANGQLWVGDGNVIDLNTNIGGLSTTGVDVSVNYSRDLADFGLPDYGSLGFSMNGTWLQSLETDTGIEGDPARTYDCAGFFANQCGVPNPEWRHRARLSWQTPWAVDLSTTWRYYGEVDLAALDASDGSLDNDGSRLDSTFDDKHYFDLSASWAVRDTTSLRVGVNNVFDIDPPLSYSVGTTGNNNTYPQLYDALGRFFFFGITQNF